MIDSSELRQILGHNFFEVFAISPSFDIDQNALAVVYRQQQKQYHPDNSVQQDAEFQALILSVSAHINNAYTNLKNPLNRALLLLELNSLPLDLAHDTVLPPQFLMEQMEFHEELDDAKHSKDIEQLEQLEQSVQKKEQHIILQLSTAFQQQEFDRARNLTKQLAFYQRVLGHVSNAISSIC